MILPIGTPVWVAVTECPDVGRTGWFGDGLVVAHAPCSPCWQQVVGSGRLVTLDDIYLAGASCAEPSAYTVRSVVGDWLVTIAPGDPAALAVPLQFGEAA